MNYVITKNRPYFEKIGKFNYCNLEDMILPDIIAVDSETTGLDSKKEKMFCLQTGTGENNYIVDFQDFSTSLFPCDRLTFQEVIPYLKDKKMVFHNACFDISFFYEEEFYPDFIYDTMVASMILHNGGNVHSHSLKSVFERELGIILVKDEQKNIHKQRLSTPEAIEYCFKDVDQLLELHDNLLKKLENHDALETYNLNCAYVKGLAYMERCGLPIDEEYWKAKMISDKEESRKREKEISEYIFDTLPKYRDLQLDMFDNSKKIVTNLSSPKQMINIFQDLGIPCKDDEGNDTTEEKVINKCDHEFVPLWLKYKEAEHNVTTFGQKILDKVIDGRIYSSFKVMVDTCRTVSRKGGINFLNFPASKETRDCFRSKPGFKMIVCDYSNQEVVCLTDLSQDLGLLDNILNKRDSHSKMAIAAFEELEGLTDDEVKENHKDLRQRGKIINFTVAFGGNGFTIAKNLNLPLEEGERLYGAYRGLYPGIFTWGDEVLKKSLQTGFIESAMGFKLKLPFFDLFQGRERAIKAKSKQFWEMYREGKNEHKLLWATKEKQKKDPSIPDYVIENEVTYNVYKNNKKEISDYFKARSEYSRLCLNNPCQATAAHQSKLAMVKIFNYIKRNDLLNKVKICNFIYDELVFEVIEEEVERMLPVIGKLMRDAANSLLKSGLVSMEADAHAGDSWYEAKG